MLDVKWSWDAILCYKVFSSSVWQDFFSASVFVDNHVKTNVNTPTLSATKMFEGTLVLGDSKVKYFPEPQGPQRDADLRFLSPQPNTDWHCQTADTGVVHSAVCLSTSQLSPVLTAPNRVGWQGWVDVACSVNDNDNDSACIAIGVASYGALGHVPPPPSPSS